MYHLTTKLWLSLALFISSFVVTAQTKVVVSEITINPDINYLFDEDVTIKAAADGTALTIAPGTASEIFFKFIQQGKSNKASGEDQNFVRTETAKFPTTNEEIFTRIGPDKKTTSYSYTDGLGKPIPPERCLLSRYWKGIGYI